MSIKKSRDDKPGREHLSDHQIAAKRKYSDAELIKWSEHFKKFIKEIEVSTPHPETLKILDIEKILFTYGATNKDGAVLIDEKGDGISVGDGMHIVYPTKYAEINHIINSVQEWRGRKEYGKRKSLEELSQGLAHDKKITYDKPRLCSQCPKELPAHLADVCSGECYVEKQGKLELEPHIDDIPA